VSYTIYPSLCVVKRDSDGAVVSPAQSINDALFVEYTAWIEAGNNPTVAVEAAPVGQRLLTRLSFRRRFTLSERVSIDNSTDPVVRTLLTDVAMAEEINLDDADLASGLAYVEQLGLIAPGRSGEILG